VRAAVQTGALAAALAACVALVGSVNAIGGAGANSLTLSVVVALVVALVIVALAGAAISARHALAASRALIEAGHYERAIWRLKQLEDGEGKLTDAASYLIALAYDRQGELQLAYESYRDYEKRFEEKGAWVVEARVRIAQLKEHLERAGQVEVRSAPSGDPGGLRCPYCKDALGEDEPLTECPACGARHHEACYADEGGCAVYGCKQKAGAKAPVRE